MSTTTTTAAVLTIDEVAAAPRTEFDKVYRIGGVPLRIPVDERPRQCTECDDVYEAHEVPIRTYCNGNIIRMVCEHCA